MAPGSALAYVAVVAAFGLVFLSAEIASRAWQLPVETTRKYVHVAGCLVAIPVPTLLGIPGGVALAVAASGLLALSRRRRLLPSVHGVERDTVGEVLFPLGLALAAVLFPDPRQYAFGVIVLGLSDTAAAVVGQRWGSPWWPGRIATSAAGSAAFLVVTVLVAAWFALGDDDPVRAWALLLSALLVTAVEALLARGVDNLVLPAASAAAFGWMFVA